MKADTFLNSMGMIDDRFLDVSSSWKKNARQKFVKALASAAAAIALIVFPLPVMTAFGADNAYYILYNIAPSVAQTFKPVQESCTDNGIEMTVISAERSGNKASVYLAMHDRTGTCPEGDWDLYDSYSINVPRDMTEHCSFSEYDKETHTAYFIVHLETMDGSEMPESKVTFSVREMLLGKETVSGKIKEIDMNNIPYEPETAACKNVSGAAYYYEEPNPEDYRFLIPSEQPVYSPMEGIEIVGIGYVEGALHILTEYKDNLHTDNHGYIELLDSGGNVVSEKESITFHYWDDTRKNNFTEQIIPVPYDALTSCTMSGEFVTSQKYISGDWEITFPLN